MRSLDIDESRWPPKKAQWFINGKKDEGVRPQHINYNDADVFTHTMFKIYDAYQKACEQSSLVDFAELLLRSLELLRENKDVLAHYQQRFQHVLVDEFQDTNAIQYAWLRLIAGKQSYMMVVGDDDQSIYGWRGAKIENIHKFSKDYEDVTTVRLEQNYRSTGTILKAANALIDHNDDRLGKNLWTDGTDGEPISVYAAFNDIDEARFIVSRIVDWVAQGNPRKEAAILYRSNAQSRILEEALMREGMPYRVYGGQRFFERAEIKDALSYCRMIINRNDDAAFERIVNKPTRGIGDRTLTEVRDFARINTVSLWEACIAIADQKTLPARAGNAIIEFLKLIDQLDNDIAQLTLQEKIDHVITHSGLKEYFKKEKSEKSQARLENLEELVTAARQYTQDEGDELPPLNAFLSQAALEAGEGQADPYEDCVQLMTLHSAKGLEFPLVFIGGVEEGLFPHPMSMEEEGRLEEERRLCYVGITRAMQKLFITYAEKRNIHGQEKYHRASRFISEIPEEFIEPVRMTTSIKRTNNFNAYGSDASDTGFTVGQRVLHKNFGPGTVCNYEGNGPHARIQVKFDQNGIKWLVLSYAGLEPA